MFKLKDKVKITRANDKNVYEVVSIQTTTFESIDNEPQIEYVFSFDHKEEGRFGSTVGLTALYRDGKWLNPYSIEDDDLEWKVEKIIE